MNFLKLAMNDCLHLLVIHSVDSMAGAFWVFKSSLLILLWVVCDVKKIVVLILFLMIFVLHKCRI